MRNLQSHLRNIVDSRYRKHYLQRRYRDIASRERRSATISAKLPRFEGIVSPFADHVAEAVNSRGYASLSGRIPRSAVARLRDYFVGLPVRDRYRVDLGEFVPPDDIPPGTHLASYSEDNVARAPGIYDIANHPDLLSAAALLLGGKPTIAHMPVWWSLPAHDGTCQGTENFHRDLDDWRFVKFFIYLTDVDGDGAPMVFLSGSQADDRLLAQGEYGEQTVENTFGTANLVEFFGAASTAFLVNTFGMHRQKPALHKPTLTMSVTYSLGPNPYGPKAPLVTLGEPGIPDNLDPYINRIYCHPLAD